MNPYEEMRQNTVETLIIASLLMMDMSTEDDAPEWVSSLAILNTCIAAFLEEPISETALLKLCHVALALINDEIEKGLAIGALPPEYENWLKSG